MSELCKAYGNDNCISEKANILPKVTHHKVEQDKGQKKTGLVSGRVPLFLSQPPSELRLTKDFTPKEARSFSDPLIPPPATSSTECQQQAGQPPHSPGLWGSSSSLHGWPTDCCYPRKAGRATNLEGHYSLVPRSQAEVKLLRGLQVPSPILPKLPVWLLTHSCSSPLCPPCLPALASTPFSQQDSLPSLSVVFPAGPLRRDPWSGGRLHSSCCVTVTLMPFLALAGCRAKQL